MLTPGLEPGLFAMSKQRVNQLHYASLNRYIYHPCWILLSPPSTGLIVSYELLLSIPSPRPLGVSIILLSYLPKLPVTVNVVEVQ